MRAELLVAVRLTGNEVRHRQKRRTAVGRRDEAVDTHTDVNADEQGENLFDDDHVAVGFAFHRAGDVLAEEAREEAVMV